MCLHKISGAMSYVTNICKHHARGHTATILAVCSFACFLSLFTSVSAATPLLLGQQHTLQHHHELQHTQHLAGAVKSGAIAIAPESTGGSPSNANPNSNVNNPKSESSSKTVAGGLTGSVMAASTRGSHGEGSSNYPPQTNTLTTRAYAENDAFIVKTESARNVTISRDSVRIVSDILVETGATLRFSLEGGGGGGGGVLEMTRNITV